MRIRVADWLFDVDISKTMDYSAKVWEDHCECGYCRNFYKTLNNAYPQLVEFLNQFGMNSLTPEEMSPIEPTLCIVSYCISGRVVEKGVFPVDIGGVMMSVSEDYENPLYELPFGTPFFVFTTGLLELPWVLDEDMNEVISPANEPEYLQRMVNRYLETIDAEDVLS